MPKNSIEYAKLNEFYKLVMGWTRKKNTYLICEKENISLE